MRTEGVLIHSRAGEPKLNLQPLRKMPSWVDHEDQGSVISLQKLESLRSINGNWRSAYTLDLGLRECYLNPRSRRD